jgi:hypothetical protein
VVRQHHLVELGDEVARADQVAEARGGHRPGLGEGAGDDEGRGVVDQLEGGPRSELAVGLVHHQQPRCQVEHGSDGGFVLEHAGGVVGRRQEGDGRRGVSEHATDLVEVEAEVLAPLPDRHRGAGDARDVAVERVGGLEDGGGAARAAVGEAQRLEHLVGAVGREDLLGRHVVVPGDRLAEAAVRAVGVAVPLHGRDLGLERVDEALRRRDRCLVGVQPDGHVDLGRVVPLHEREVVARRDAHAWSWRRRMESAWASSPS